MTNPELSHPNTLSCFVESSFTAISETPVANVILCVVQKVSIQSVDPQMSSVSQRKWELRQHQRRPRFKGLLKKWLFGRHLLRGITLAIRLSAHWLGACQQRPGCHSYRPPSPPALAGFLLLSTLCCVPTLLLHPCLFLSKAQGLTNFTDVSLCVCVCACAAAWNHVCVNPSVLCRVAVVSHDDFWCSSSCLSLLSRTPPQFSSPPLFFLPL